MFQSKWPFFHSESGTVSVTCSIPSCPFFHSGTRQTQFLQLNWYIEVWYGTKLPSACSVIQKNETWGASEKESTKLIHCTTCALVMGMRKNQLARWMHSAETHHRVHTKVPRGKQAEVKTWSPVRHSINWFSTAWIDQRPLVPHFYINCDMEDALTLESYS